MTSLTRRSLLAGVSSFMIIKPELVRGAGPEKLKFGLVGCGGRGLLGEALQFERARHTQLGPDARG